jgi:hypothetical protein
MATIVLSLRDKIHLTAEALLKLALMLMGLKPCSKALAAGIHSVLGDSEHGSIPLPIESEK